MQCIVALDINRIDTLQQKRNDCGANSIALTFIEIMLMLLIWYINEIVSKKLLTLMRTESKQLHQLTSYYFYFNW